MLFQYIFNRYCAIDINMIRMMLILHMIIWCRIRLTLYYSSWWFYTCLVFYLLKCMVNDELIVFFHTVMLQVFFNVGLVYELMGSRVQLDSRITEQDKMSFMCYLKQYHSVSVSGYTVCDVMIWTGQFSITASRRERRSAENWPLAVDKIWNDKKRQWVHMMMMMKPHSAFF